MGLASQDDISMDHRRPGRPEVFNGLKGALAAEAVAWSWAHLADVHLASVVPTPPSGALVLGFISWRELG
jgi:hypothetical protein